MLSTVFKKILLASSITIAFSVFALTVNAQNKEGGYIISPAIERLNLAPGETHGLTFKITNSEAKPLKFKFSEGEFTLGEDGSTAYSQDNSKTTGWLVYPTSEVVIQPNQTKDITVSINVPLATEIGVYVPAILVESQNVGTREGTSTQIHLNSAYIVAINVINSYPIKTVEVVDLTATNPVVTAELDISYLATNITTSYAKPILKLQVLGADGARLWENVINENMSTLAPKQSLSDSLTLSSSDLELNTLGVYTIQLLSTDTQFNTASFAEIQVVILPIPALLAILVGLVLVATVVVVLVIYRRKRRRYSAGVV